MLRDSWRFAAGMSAIIASALVLTQLDKLLLSRLLTLEVFGYYMLANVVTNGLYIFINPVFDALFPRLSVLAAAGDTRGVRETYHNGTQALATLVLPPATMLTLFASPLLRMWTGSPEAARQTAPIVSLLAVGTAVNGLMHAPYALQLAHGWTTLGLRINLCLIAVVAPAVALTALYWGSTGAAAVWVGANLAYLAAGLPLTHRRLLPGSTARWLLADVGRPLVAALTTAGVGRSILGSATSPGHTLAVLLTVGTGAFAAAALAAPRIRFWLLARSHQWVGRSLGRSDRREP